MLYPQNYRKNACFLALLLFLFSDISYSQAKTKTFRSGVTLNTFKINDHAASSLTQQNTLFGFYFSFGLHSAKSYESISINTFSGKLYNHLSFAETSMNNAYIDWFKTWNVKPERNLPIYLGFNLRSSSVLTKREKFPNNSGYSTFSTSLSLAFRVEKQIINRRNKPVDLSFTGSFLVFSYIIRPSLGSVAPISYSGEISQDFDQYMTSGRFVTINKLQYYYASTSVVFHPWKKVFLSLGYNWSFFHYTVDPSYFEINHQVFLNLGIQF